MPLLCISLLVLLLLPLSLSCDSKRSLEEVREDYSAIVETDLKNTRESIATLVQNSSCLELEHKLPNCTLGNMDFLTTLHVLNCKLNNLGFSHTLGLVTSVQNSIQCPCPEKLTKGPNRKSRNRTRRKRNGLKKSKRETKKLCKANAILSTMTECYEMLNTALMDT